MNFLGFINCNKIGWWISSSGVIKQHGDFYKNSSLEAILCQVLLFHWFCWALLLTRYFLSCSIFIGDLGQDNTYSISFKFSKLSCPYYFLLILEIFSIYYCTVAWDNTFVKIDYNLFTYPRENTKKCWLLFPTNFGGYFSFFIHDSLLVCVYIMMILIWILFYYFCRLSWW